jgi:hypothetical protein
MIFFIATISCVIIATIALWGYARYARVDMYRLSAREKCSDCFFDCATKFAEIETTPYSLLRDIRELNRSLDDSRTSARILHILKTIPLNRVKADRFGEIFRFLDRENLVSLYREMANSYILMISYKDRIRGHKIRNLLESAVKSEQKMANSSSAESTPAVAAVDSLLAADHDTTCLTVARSWKPTRLSYSGLADYQPAGIGRVW